MATPEIASSPPTINFGVMRSPRNNTLEIKANTGSSRPKGATRAHGASGNQPEPKSEPNNSSNENCVGECQPATFIRRDKACQLSMFNE